MLTYPKRNFSTINRIQLHLLGSSLFCSCLRSKLISSYIYSFGGYPSKAFYCGIKLVLKMKCYDLQKNAFSASACEEMRGSLPITDQNGTVICPKPRRVGVLTNMPIWPLRWHLSQQAEGSDSKAGAELLDIILKKESYGEEYANQVASSPPYFCGSPPVRAANPLIQDARFGDEEHTPMSAISSSIGLLSPSSTSHKGGCARMKFGLKPAAVRVEGFDCLSRDRQNSSIPAVA